MAFKMKSSPFNQGKKSTFGGTPDSTREATDKRRSG